jgi:putative transposase
MTYSDSEGRALSRPCKVRDATAGVPPVAVSHIPSGRQHPVHQPLHERYNVPVIVFVTVCSKGHKRIFADPGAQRTIQAAWLGSRNWLVGRYVLMPDHVHLFCGPAALAPESLQNWVAFWKSSAARHWPRPHDAPIWQRHCWDTQLRRGESYKEKWDYVVTNPVRAGLVAKSEDWPYQGEMNVLRW